MRIHSWRIYLLIGGGKRFSFFMSFSSNWLLANFVHKNLSAVLSGTGLSKSVLDSSSLRCVLTKNALYFSSRSEHFLMHVTMDFLSCVGYVLKLLLLFSMSSVFHEGTECCVQRPIKCVSFKYYFLTLLSFTLLSLLTFLSFLKTKSVVSSPCV